MSTDPFEQLRITNEPAAPERRFVAGLRRRLEAALDAAATPIVDLPERSTAMSEPTSSTNASTVSNVSTAGAPPATVITPYLCVEPAADAITWYVDVLGATENVRYTGDDGRIGHAELSIGGATFMLSDAYPEMDVPVRSPAALGGTPFSMHLSVPDTDAVFERVRTDGRAAVGRPPHDEAYGARTFDMVDPFGHRWMIQTQTSQPTTAEIQAGMPGYTVDEPAGSSGQPAAAPVEIGYATFSTPDTARARDFYSTLFGWAVETGNMGDEYAHVANTRLPMGITPGPIDEAPTIYYRVPDVAVYAARVRELGGEVLTEVTYESGPSATCRDDQGREFQLWQPAPGYE